MNLKEIFIKNKCDKATKHRYYELYQQDFDKFKNDEITSDFRTSIDEINQKTTWIQKRIKFFNTVIC